MDVAVDCGATSIASPVSVSACPPAVPTKAEPAPAGGVTTSTAIVPDVSVAGSKASDGVTGYAATSVAPFWKNAKSCSDEAGCTVVPLRNS